MPVRFLDSEEFEVSDLPTKAVRKGARKAAKKAAESQSESEEEAESEEESDEESEEEAKAKPPVKRKQSALKAKGGVRKRVLPKREPPKTPRPRAGSRCGRIRRR
jgi:hypothetical protein